jgi:hypothetical protein
MITIVPSSAESWAFLSFYGITNFGEFVLANVDSTRVMDIAIVALCRWLCMDVQRDGEHFVWAKSS